ncbi:MAG: CRISPR system precrRNA processing endoribonuclease RAMP protein Cas6 [Anaerolineae bacterium]|nr:CRISPR system precrRNA processing endoribonuclease RAMP protein Cas6 [Anaerolineae bacterium]
MTNLTYTHLTFDCIADTPVHLGGYWAGNRLRGALANVLRRTTCPEQHNPNPPHEHSATCPACWLLNHKLDPGHARRAYSLAPPLPPQETVQPGQHFRFTITLYGEGWQFLPYFVLAVGEMAHTGVGQWRDGARGTFTVAAITARNPFTDHTELLMEPGSDYIKVPEHPIAWSDIFHSQSTVRNSQLTIHFLTPTRFIHDHHLAKMPDFGIFFRRLLHRIDTLGTQLAGTPRRAETDIERLHVLADKVRLIDADMHWIELRPRSGRDGQFKPMSGFIGKATYSAENWQELWPYVIFGQGIQVGKSTSKGNGVYQVVGFDPMYWLDQTVANRAGFGTK